MAGTFKEDIVDNSVVNEMRDSFLEYAMSVIYARALPDVRDGLKPVQRRILFTMHDSGLRPSVPHTKCAHIVGATMGRLHPHGDTAIYDAMVRMAQSFSLRLPLIDGHGNFGSLGGEDPAAAYRYTEARMAPAALAMVNELAFNTVDFADNYDGRVKEPVVLPAAFPNLLVNGVSGVAVGMATKMPPHNLNEVIDGLCAMLENPKITLDELMTHIKAPDFPTGGIVIGTDGIKEAYATGRGSFTIRALAKVEDLTARRKGIVVTELPYKIGPENIVKAIRDAKNANKLDGVHEVRNLSGRKVGLRLVIECKVGFNPHAVLEKLYKMTKLQDTFSVNNVALVNGQPQTLGLLALCRHYLEHRREVVRRRIQHELDKAERRAHIIEGLLIALDPANLDEVIAIIRGSNDLGSARTKLCKAFKLSEIQANYILDSPLRNLTRLEVTKLKNELKELQAKIKEFKRLLGSPKALGDLIGQELREQVALYGTPRRSRVLHVAPDPGVSAESMEVADSPCTVALTTTGLIGRVDHADGKVPAFKGKHGPLDLVLGTLTTTTRATVGAVTDRGRLLRAAVVEFPVIAGKLRGKPAREFFVDLDPEERVLALVSLPDPKAEATKSMPGLAMATAQGVVKRIGYDQLPAKSGMEAISLKEGDTLVGVKHLESDQADLVLVASNAQLLRMPADSVRPQGRTSGGVAGMKLAPDAKVVAFGVVESGDADVVLASVSDGDGVKVTPISEYPVKGRAGAGVRCQVFRRGETMLAAAWVGSGAPLAAGAAGELVAYPTEHLKRDASGVKSPEPITVFGAPRR